ncbi:SLC4A4 [Symbiodinium natans]|uniref:SLC4A4 protein n=1 Tax=Symbiodinium natans TaxID=878477 RepID=A0A812QCK9_9DINO|nr:SLC4A4 [Symbiodinium natans]
MADPAGPRLVPPPPPPAPDVWWPPTPPPEVGEEETRRGGFALISHMAVAKPRLAGSGYPAEGRTGATNAGETRFVQKRCLPPAGPVLHSAPHGLGWSQVWNAPQPVQGLHAGVPHAFASPTAGRRIVEETRTAYADAGMLRSKSPPPAMRLVSQPAVQPLVAPTVHLAARPHMRQPLLSSTDAVKSMGCTRQTLPVLPTSKSMHQLPQRPQLPQSIEPKSVMGVGACPISGPKRPGKEALSDDELRLLAEEVLHNFVASSLLRKLSRGELDALLKAHLGDQHAARLMAQKAHLHAATERVISSSASLGALHSSEARLEDAQHKLALAKAEAMESTLLGRIKERAERAERADMKSESADAEIAEVDGLNGLRGQGDGEIDLSSPLPHVSQMCAASDMKLPDTSHEGFGLESLEEPSVLCHERSRPRTAATNEDLGYIFGEVATPVPPVSPPLQLDVRFSSPPRPSRMKSVQALHECWANPYSKTRVARPG